jgi:hypothetical protein
MRATPCASRRFVRGDSLDKTDYRAVRRSSDRVPANGSIFDNRFDYAAQKTGTVIIPSCGFDSIPSDLSAYVSSRTIKSLAGLDSSVDESLSAFKLKGGISGGTFASAFSLIEEVPKEHRDGAAMDYAISPGLTSMHPHLLA